MVQEIGTSLGGLCEHVEKLNTSVNEQLTEMKTGLTAVENRFVGMENKFENRLGEMEDKFEKVENRFGEMENKFEKKFEEMEKRFEKVENQFLKIDNPRFKDGQHEEVHDERESARSAQATPVDPSSDTKDAKNPHKYAYVVAGGYGKEGKPLNSAEIFDKTTNSWIQLEPMKKFRAKASSVVYDSHVLVTGGTTDGTNILSSMEQLNSNSNPFVPPFWYNFPVNLPRALRGHRNVLYNDRLIVLGGDDEDYSDMIYEIQLQFPFNTKVLAKLPPSIPIKGCGAVLSNDKILIFGGSRKYPGHGDLASCNVTMYDITKNEFQQLAPLPHGACNMATVKFGENVIVAGCSTQSYWYGHTVTDVHVVSYNIETQRSTKLAKMNSNRSECCAVVDGNSLIVMGGYQLRGGAVLNSVEAFDFRSSQWRNLPSMKEARRGFIAEII
jgi:N-acetylneuraminic acid mutarotase